MSDQINVKTETHLPAIIQGTPLENLPTNLYIPPNALQVFLKSFEGPLDLLLYLIQQQDFDILNIPIADISRQYLQYVEFMQELNLDLAAEYLVMAATLMEIKSRLLLPTHQKTLSESDDPRNQLIKQLREYAQYKQAAEDLERLPQINRDIFLSAIDYPKLPKEIIIPDIDYTAFLQAIQEVMARATLFTSHQIIREPLSVRERMSLILTQLKSSQTIDFIDFFTLEEGRAGVVVTFLALLELAKESLIQIIQTQPFERLSVIRQSN